jgi:hypothetical protein
LARLAGDWRPTGAVAEAPAAGGHLELAVEGGMSHGWSGEQCSRRCGSMTGEWPHRRWSTECHDDWEDEAEECGHGQWESAGDHHLVSGRLQCEWWRTLL